MKIAITGIPGSGKTTLAGALAVEFGLPVVSSGDIARRLDPEALARGEMANMRVLAQALMQTLDPLDGWILDGWPRTVAQYQLLDPEARLILLTCRADVAIDRQLLRGREGDTEEIIAKRTHEQAELLGMGTAVGWAGEAAGWGATINTTRKQPDLIAHDVAAFLRGEKREAF